MNKSDFGKFLKTVLPGMGYNWTRFDRRNIRRRIRSRMEALRIYELEKYAQTVLSDPSEQTALDSLLKLTITRFFRNSWLWSDLGTTIPGIAGMLGNDEPLAIWSAGCAGGEEPFSLAMLMDDLQRTGKLSHPWHILGTDTDKAVWQRTLEGKYKRGTIREVPRHLLERWFREDAGGWILAQEVRNLVEFRRHDLLTADAPGRFHMVFLRNSILTYNTVEMQRRVLEHIYHCLLDPGYLIIGRTERLPESVGFEQISRCVYRLIQDSKFKIQE